MSRACVSSVPLDPGASRAQIRAHIDPLAGASYTSPVLVAARTWPGPPGSSAASRWLSSVLARVRCAGPASPGPPLAGPGRELTAQSLPLPPVPGDQPRQKPSLVSRASRASAASMMAPTVISTWDWRLRRTFPAILHQDFQSEQQCSAESLAQCQIGLGRLACPPPCHHREPERPHDAGYQDRRAQCLEALGEMVRHRGERLGRRLGRGEQRGSSQRSRHAASSAGPGTSSGVSHPLCRCGAPAPGDAPGKSLRNHL